MFTRYLYLISALTSALIVGLLYATSYYLQKTHHWFPCPFCSLQRGLLGIISLLLFLNAILAYYYARQAINSLISLIAICGMVLASWQLWLSSSFSSPAQPGSMCRASLTDLIKTSSTQTLLNKILHGEIRECVQKEQQPFFLLNMTQWALLCFILLFCFVVYLLIKEYRQASAHL